MLLSYIDQEDKSLNNLHSTKVSYLYNKCFSNEKTHHEAKSMSTKTIFFRRSTMCGCGYMLSIVSFVETLVILRYTTPCQGAMMMLLSHIDQEMITLMIEPTLSEIIPLERPTTRRCVHTSLGVNSAMMKLKLEAIIQPNLANFEISFQCGEFNQYPSIVLLESINQLNMFIELQLLLTTRRLLKEASSWPIKCEKMA